MESWEQEIVEELQEVQSVAVRFDIPQELTETQKLTARTNIDYVGTTEQISGDDYRIKMP